MRSITFITAFLLAVPGVVFAHATPVEMHPTSGAQLTDAPKEITIRFSERLESGSSRIKVADTAGNEMISAQATVGADDRYTLTAPLAELTGGVYTVSWSVVSADDGHFTKGSYAFSVGSAIIPSSAADSTIVQITSYPEVGAMFVEFLGNSLLWGIFALFALVLRPLLREKRFATHRDNIQRIYTALVVAGVGLGILGAVAQLLWKAYELAQLHEEVFVEGLHMYTYTAAGSASLWRIVALTAFAGIFFFIRKKMFRSERFTVGERALLAALLAFAYFRALVSHATANPFLPDLSVAINMLHLVEKDVWLGALIVLIVLFATSARYTLLPAMLPRTFAFLAANFAFLTCTAGYIIWLHLKDFGNISSTVWGENFLMLFSAALILVALRAYHTYSLYARRSAHKRYFAFSISAEAGVAALVILFTSLVIITSPPLHTADSTVFSSRESGASIRLEKSAYEDTKALLTVQGGEPIVLIGGEGGLRVALEKRFEGGYVFPLALIENKSTDIHITVPQEGAYDARAVFSVDEQDFSLREGHGRTVDTFTFIVLSVVFLGVLFGILLYSFAKRSEAPDDIPARYPFLTLAGGLLAGTAGVLLLASLTQAVFGNDFKKQCEADGNMWHLMLPTRAGVPTSLTPREGCMWGMGSYMYMFADKREYQYASSLGGSDVELTHGPLVAGVPAKLDIAITDENGNPAMLLVEMERLVHVVIVSKDQKVFAHLHPDDERPLTPQEISSSRFSVEHVFPRGGEYIVAVDYAHGVVLKSQQFVVEVGGSPKQETETRVYPSPANFQGYDVSLDYSQPFAGEVATFRYEITKDGKPAELSPYLSAAMHIAIVKNDFSSFLHTHGEVHPPGVPILPVIVRGGRIVHSMAAMQTPTRFALPVDAHVLFPEPGVYTVWGQFKAGEEVVPTAFTVRVE